MSLGGPTVELTTRTLRRPNLDASPSLTSLVVTVGSDAQPQTVILDTGSSDLYFVASNSSPCKPTSDDQKPCVGGSFDRSSSSTYRQLSSNAQDGFETSFVDRSTASGPFVEDTIGIGSMSLANVQFGVAEEITGGPIGLLGLGYSSFPNEGIHLLNQTYPNVIDSMVDAGVIESRLYSAHLGRQYLSGSILFGGIDTARYSGPLTTLNLLPSYSADKNDLRISNFITTITAAELTIQGQNQTLWGDGPADFEAYLSNSSLPVILDTGSTIWTVRDRTYLQLRKLFPYVDAFNQTPCSAVDSSAYLSLTFGGKAHIQVPATEFFSPFINDTTGKSVEYHGTGNNTCSFMIRGGAPDSEGFGSAGDPILRSMYTVFDLDNGQVSIAQANTDTSIPSNVVEVKAGPDGVAKAVSGVVAAPSNTWSIVSAPTGTLSISAATLASTIGTATGINAIPSDGQVSGTIPAVGSSVSSTFMTSITTSIITTPTVTSTSSTPPAGSPSPGRGTFSKDGALVCNGPNEFGLCNFGQVIWQPVAPGTACKNDGIIGVGIYAVPA